MVPIRVIFGEYGCGIFLDVGDLVALSMSSNHCFYWENNLLGWDIYVPSGTVQMYFLIVATNYRRPW